MHRPAKRSALSRCPRMPRCHIRGRCRLMRCALCWATAARMPWWPRRRRRIRSCCACRPTSMARFPRIWPAVLKRAKMTRPGWRCLPHGPSPRCGSRPARQSTCWWRCLIRCRSCSDHRLATGGNWRALWCSDWPISSSTRICSSRSRGCCAASGGCWPPAALKRWRWSSLLPPCRRSASRSMALRLMHWPPPGWWKGSCTPLPMS